MKKICYVTTIADSLAFFIDQLKYLADNGYEVYAISSHSEDIELLLGEGIRFKPVDMPRGISVIGTIKSILCLKRIFTEEKFDLIQYSTPNAAFYASIAAKIAGCKVRNYHLMGLRYLSATGIGKKILKLIEKITCDNSTHIECVSQSNLELGIKERLFIREKATIVWHGSSGGVNLKRFDYHKREKWRAEIRTELGYAEHDFVYGFVGRITKDKGIDELLEAFFRLNCDDKLLLVGRIEGEENLDSTLLEKAKHHPKIQFHSFTTDIERYYAAIDVLILPSYREGFGNVVIEAGAVGTPAIVSKIPGPIDTIDEGKTALTVKVKDASDLAEKMKIIRKSDYKLMGQNAARFAKEKFDSEVLCELLLKRKEKMFRDNL